MHDPALAVSVDSHQLEHPLLSVELARPQSGLLSTQQSLESDLVQVEVACLIEGRLFLHQAMVVVKVVLLKKKNQNNEENDGKCHCKGLHEQRRHFTRLTSTLTAD